MLPIYRLKIANFYNSPSSNVKKWLSDIFGKEKYMVYYENLQLF